MLRIGLISDMIAHHHRGAGRAYKMNVVSVMGGSLVPEKSGKNGKKGE